MAKTQNKSRKLKEFDNELSRHIVRLSTSKDAFRIIIDAIETFWKAAARVEIIHFAN